MKSLTEIPEYNRLLEISYEISMERKNLLSAKTAYQAAKSELASNVKRQQKLLNDRDASFSDVQAVRQKIKELENTLPAIEAKLDKHQGTIFDLQQEAKKVEIKFEKELLPIVNEQWRIFIKNTEEMANQNKILHQMLKTANDCYSVIGDVCGKQLLNLWPAIDFSTTDRILKYSDFHDERWRASVKQLSEKIKNHK